MNAWERILGLDRRWVFVGIALAVVLPIVGHVVLLQGQVTPGLRGSSTPSRA